MILCVCVCVISINFVGLTDLKQSYDESVNIRYLGLVIVVVESGFLQVLLYQIPRWKVSRLNFLSCMNGLLPIWEQLSCLGSVFLLQEKRISPYCQQY